MRDSTPVDPSATMKSPVGSTATPAGAVAAVEDDRRAVAVDEERAPVGLDEEALEAGDAPAGTEGARLLVHDRQPVGRARGYSRCQIAAGQPERVRVDAGRHGAGVERH